MYHVFLNMSYYSVENRNIDYFSSIKDLGPALITSPKDYHSQVVEVLSKEPLHPCYALRIGDQVQIKVFQRKNYLAPH